MASETWERKWAEFVQRELDPARGGMVRDGVLVFLDGTLLVESRRRQPADYVWTAITEPIPRFDKPVRAGSKVSVVGLNPPNRRDYRVTAKLTPGSELVQVESL